MFQGPEVNDLNYEPYRYDFSKLSGAVLTHAHLDHCGRLPILIPGGFTAPIWMTEATADLAEVVLLDSARIAQVDKKRILYTKEQSMATIEYFRRVKYGEPFDIASFTITMRDAGHILGSASLEVVDNESDTEIRKIVFSGDLGNTPNDLLHPTELIDTADAVVMESTYGDRIHPVGDETEVLSSEIEAIEQSRGTLLIPAFSLQRTQQLLHLLLHLKKSDKVSSDLRVYTDSPMAQKATDIYMRHPDDLNGHIRQELGGNGPFKFPGLVKLNHQNQRSRMLMYKGPKVIIAGSGMMTGGRILGHAAEFLPIKSTRLLIVGYQGDNTLGRAILDGEKQVEINNKSVTIQATVNSIQTMSAHADQSQLLDWLRHIRGVRKVFLTHGDDLPREELSKKITSDLNIIDIVRPAMYDEIKF